MDPTTFDRLVRSFAGAASRRSLLRGAVGAVAGVGAAAATARQDAAAACIDVDSNEECERDNDCCGDDARCRNGRCQCRSGFRACQENGKKQCFARRGDEDHCGRCGRRCRNGETCDGRRCRSTGDRDDNDRCAEIGQRCDDRSCCGGLRCVAGNDAFRACTL